MLPFLQNTDSNDHQLQSAEKKKPLTTATSRRRHWTITRNTASRQKGKEKEDDHIDNVGGSSAGVEVPAWQTAREAHTVDFGCFALLEAELEAEMRRRKLGVGASGVNGTESTTGVNGVTGSVLTGGEDKEDDVKFELIRSSLNCSRAVRSVGGGEDGAAAPTRLPSATSSTKTTRTADNLLANAYWTTQRAAEAEDYIRDIVYGGVDGLAYVRSLAEFVGGSHLHWVRAYFSEANKSLDFYYYYLLGFRRWRLGSCM